MYKKITLIDWLTGTFIPIKQHKDSSEQCPTADPFKDTHLEGTFEVCYFTC